MSRQSPTNCGRARRPGGVAWPRTRSTRQRLVRRRSDGVRRLSVPPRDPSGRTVTTRIGSAVTHAVRNTRSARWRGSRDDSCERNRTRRQDRFDQLRYMEQRCQAVTDATAGCVLPNQSPMLIGPLAFGEWWNSRCGQPHPDSVPPGRAGRVWDEASGTERTRRDATNSVDRRFMIAPSRCRRRQ